LIFCALMNLAISAPSFNFNVAYGNLELIALLQETAKSLCRIPSSVPPR
jgi:hypothetical protein